MVGVIEALVPSIYAPLYSQIYAATLTTFPGAFFLVGGGLKIFAVLIFLWMYLEYRREGRKKYSIESNEIETKEKVESLKSVNTIDEALTVHI